MKKTTQLLALLLLVSKPIATSSIGRILQTTTNEEDDANAEIARAFMQAAFMDYDSEVVDSLLGDPFIQHNPGAPDGRDTVISLAGAASAVNLTAKVHRVISDNNLVAVHSTYRNADLFGLNASILVGFDMFRIENGLIVEHWDNLQVRPEEKNPSGRSMTSGRKKLKFGSQSKEDSNRVIIQNFAQKVLVEGNFTVATETIDLEDYRQHNPSVGDGFDALAAAFSAGPIFVYTDIVYTVVQGNFGLTVANGTFAGSPAAFYDLFRLVKGKIRQHWDVIQTIPPDSAFAHDNGKF